MQTFILCSLVIHIAAGIIALISGLAAIVFRNKIKNHKPFGKIYFWCMTIVFFTAIYLAAIKGNIFLFCVAFFTYYACLTAYRALKLKKLHADQQPHWFDWLIEAFFGIMHAGFVAVALLLISRGNMSFGIISLVFGILGLRGNYITIKRLRKKLEYRNYWLLAHIGGMCGSYIGAITAFLVNNNRWIHAPDLLVWLGPAAFLIPFIVFEIKRHQQKAGKFIPA
jgi:hypothetical protein